MTARWKSGPSRPPAPTRASTPATTPRTSAARHRGVGIDLGRDRANSTSSAPDGPSTPPRTRTQTRRHARLRLRPDPRPGEEAADYLWRLDLPDGRPRCHRAPGRCSSRTARAGASSRRRARGVRYATPVLHRRLDARSPMNRAVELWTLPANGLGEPSTHQAATSCAGGHHLARRDEDRSPVEPAQWVTTSPGERRSTSSSDSFANLA